MNPCDVCSSTNTYIVQVRKNRYDERSIYRCRDCDRRFTPTPAAGKKARHSADIISAALSLRAHGTSLARTVEHLAISYKVRITRKTILDWEKRFPHKVLPHEHIPIGKRQVPSYRYRSF
jgi:transposase-like protein